MTDQDKNPDFSVADATKEHDCLRASLEDRLREPTSQDDEEALLKQSGSLRMVEQLLANRSMILHYGAWDFTISLMEEVLCREALEGSLNASGVHHNVDEDDGFTRVILINVCAAEVDALIEEALSQVKTHLAGCS